MAADIGVVGHEGSSVREAHVGGIKTVIGGTAAAAISDVTGAAAELLVKLLALGNRIARTGGTGEPGGIITRCHDSDPASHDGVVGSAVLRAEKVIAAHLGGAEPQRVIAAGNVVHLDAECGDGEIVDDVLAR